jgi:hypothetical protein
MDPDTINNRTFMVSDADGVPVVGSITYDRGTYIATFSPDRLLAYSTTYVVTITVGVHDLAGNPLPAEISSSFTTEADPVR